MTQKFSQSHFRIQTRGQRNSEGPRPRRLTRTLHPSSQFPMGEYQSHRSPDSSVSTYETLNKVLTEPISPLGVDETLDRPVMITCRKITCQINKCRDKLLIFLTHYKTLITYVTKFHEFSLMESMVHIGCVSYGHDTTDVYHRWTRYNR